jgi:YidC/Oxa1 family membrane protein insertase
MIQSKFFPAPEQEVVNTPVVEETVTAAEVKKEVPRHQSASSSDLMIDSEKKIDEKTIQAETNRFLITFSNKGGVITSLKLKEHDDKGQPLEMIFRGTEEQAAFDVAFGDMNATPITENFEYKKIGDYTFEFSKTFLAPADINGSRLPFILRKVYKFTADDYMMELRIGIENSVNKIPALNFDGFSYSLTFGPQIGPEFEKLDNRYFYRRFYTYSGKKADTVKVKDGLTVLEDRVTWAAIAGKYFTAIAVPDATEYEISMSEAEVEGIPQSNQMVFSRPPIKSSNNEDVFKFYFGPKLKKYLLPYNDADENGFAMKDLNLDEIEDSSSILGWLEWLLQKGLSLVYKAIPNYGFAIIILTIFIKVVLFPLTRKSSQSTARMSALAPKMEELKAQYKEQPDKLNKAMGEMYKKEGVSPMGGCLPMLVQFPFFIAMYGLLNKYFEFRGAVFIPGWITDLAAPESIYHFAFNIPLLNWTDLRLLPILFVGSQMFSSKIMQSTQPSAAGNQSTMKMMTYAMPIMFFFILYNAPSGLLVYWICSNIFTLLQQMYTNRHLKPAAAGSAPSGGLRVVGKDDESNKIQKVVPPSKKKKKKK